MSLVEKINLDLKEAMKSQDQCKVSTLRLLKAALFNYSIETKKNQLSDPEVFGIIQKQLKMRNESLESYQKANRPELADKEGQEIKILQEYLPNQLSDDEIRQIVLECIQDTGTQNKSELGKLMKEIMPRISGQADGKRVSTIVQSLLK